jgi:hypothetical protein
MGYTVLLPGGFKPPHGKHYQLAKNYAGLDTVDKVLVIIGPKDRDGVSRKDSMDVWKILIKNDPKIKPIETENNNPLQSAFQYVEKERKGDFILAAGIKDDDQRRVRDFMTAFSPGSKYYIQGVTPHTLPNDELEKVTKEMHYSGRNDEFEGKPFSATALRRDILNDDFENFKTNYPNVPSSDVKKIWNILQGKVVPEQPKTKKKGQVKEHIADIIYRNAFNRLAFIHILTEGGNIFKNDDEVGSSATQKIKQADIDPTLEWLEKVINTAAENRLGIKDLGLDLVNNKLGSAGKKDESGDIDISVDPSKLTFDDNILPKEMLILLLQDAGYKTREIKKNRSDNPSKVYDIAKTGDQVHLKTPILGDDKKGYVQTDFMFGEPKWMKFAKDAPNPKDSKYGGVHRAMMIYSVANAKGYKFSPDKGIQKRDSGEQFISDPEEIAKLLLGPGKTPDDFYSVETIVSAIKDQPNYEEMVKDARTGGKYEFEKYGATFDDGLSGDDKVVNEVLLKILTNHIIKESMRGASGIEHIEDFVYSDGKDGAKKSLEMFDKIIKDPSLVAVKWDGSPSVIFGVDPQGNFVFTDKHDKNLSKSPEELKNLYQGRLDRKMQSNNPPTEKEIESYNRLIGKMMSNYETVKSAWPKGLVGLFTGDLMYTKNNEEGAGDKGALSFKDGKYSFKPNEVQYNVPKNDPRYGEAIGKSKIGIIPHSYRNGDTYISQLSSKDEPLKKLMSGKGDDLVIFSPDNPKSIKLDQSLYSAAKQAVSDAKDVDVLIKPDKMANYNKLMYSFTNSMLDKPNDLGYDEFVKYLENQSIKPDKKNEILQFTANNKNAVDQIFNVVKSIQALKNNLIKVLDSQSLGLPASINGNEGGEGYVISDQGSGGIGQAKLVNRGVFTAANKASHAKK